MNVKLIEASREDIPVMENLMQFYIYDFSEFVELDVKADGLFEPYAGLREYWEDEEDRFPYFIKLGETILGFVLVRWIVSGDRSYFSMAEFFIMRKYRRKGMGRSVAELAFGRHGGRWQIYQKESNKPAQDFWRKIISEYTKGQFTERMEPGKVIQEFDAGRNSPNWDNAAIALVLSAKNAIKLSERVITFTGLWEPSSSFAPSA